MNAQKTAMPPASAPKAAKKTATPPTRTRRPRGQHDARLNFRINSAQKEFIELAAFEAGQTVSEFAAAALLERAENVMERVRTTQLSERDFAAFVEAVTHPAPLPATALEMAAHLARTTRWSGESVELLPGYSDGLPAWATEGPF